MPDISMCGTEDCPMKSRCYRSPTSGTRPTEYRQSWSMFAWEAVPAAAGNLFNGCKHFWSTDPQPPVSVPVVREGR